MGRQHQDEGDGVSKEALRCLVSFVCCVGELACEYYLVAQWLQTYNEMILWPYFLITILAYDRPAVLLHDKLGNTSRVKAHIVLHGIF